MRSRCSRSGEEPTTDCGVFGQVNKGHFFKELTSFPKHADGDWNRDVVLYNIVQSNELVTLVNTTRYAALSGNRQRTFGII